MRAADLLVIVIGAFGVGSWLGFLAWLILSLLFNIFSFISICLVSVVISGILSVYVLFRILEAREHPESS